MVEEIGSILFVQFLGMTQYPSSPFTGNLFKDLIMFLIVPTIFIIIVVYSMTGRVVPGQPKLRVMLGVGAYLFIIAGGYYPAFALLAGPYFVILIFLVGIIGYISGHFSGARPAGGGPYRGSIHNEELKMGEIDDDIRRMSERLAVAQKTGSKDEAGFYAQELNRLEGQRRQLKKDITNPKRWK